MNWTRNEVELTVATYLAMLELELKGQPFAKAEFRRQLHPKLQGRSEQAIEFKFANISAALVSLGRCFINGYKPRGNIQKELLFEVLNEQLDRSPSLKALAPAPVELILALAEQEEFSNVLQTAPELGHRTESKRKHSAPRVVKRDYAEENARNSALGLAGERFVVRYEQKRLQDLGRSDLAERVRHVALDEGDGLGYDVSSFETDERELHIEVKTTALGPATPFFMSSRELVEARRGLANYRLYRVYGFPLAPRIFVLSTLPEAQFVVEAVSYRVRFAD